MKLPFVYGKIAEDENFTDREEERTHLLQNFRGMVNSIIISPRRWGKTSLVSRALTEISKEKQYLTVHIDMFNCRTEAQFYETYASAILKASASRLDEMAATIKKYLGSIGPKISLADNGANLDLSLGIDFKAPEYKVDEIIDLPQQIAVAKNKRFIVCVDEFQNISGYDEPLAFQQKLRSHWQRHSHVCYCLYGSKRHMLMDIFGNSEMPFYKFGDLFFLDKITEERWVPFLIERFGSHGKRLTDDQARLIVRLVDAHPYYVQQLAQQSWLRSGEVCQEEDIHNAHQGLIDQMNLLFCNIVDSLTPRQVGFLKAVALGEENFSSRKVLDTYNLGTSANVKNLKASLLSKDLIDILPGNRIVLQDPLFQHWLLR